jgi:hypothetical protein
MSYPPPPGPQDWKGEPQPGYGQQGQQPYGYQSPAYGMGQDPYGAPVRTSGKATTSLVLGVVSMVCFGFLTGIPAIIVGIRARKEIRLSQGRTSGDGLALGGIITGIIGTLIGLAVLALAISLIAISTSVDNVGDPTCAERALDNDPNNDCT